MTQEQLDKANAIQSEIAERKKFLYSKIRIEYNHERGGVKSSGPITDNDDRKFISMIRQRISDEIKQLYIDFKAL